MQTEKENSAILSPWKWKTEEQLLMMANMTSISCTDVHAGGSQTQVDELRAHFWEAFQRWLKDCFP